MNREYKYNKYIAIKIIVEFLFLFLIICGGLKLFHTIENNFNKTNNKIDNIEIQQNIDVKIPYRKYMGKFTATFYCNCPKCVGHKKEVRTAVGNIPYPNKTIAVDKNIIPLHSIVYIKDMGFYVAEDTGGAVKGKRVDIFVENHDKALKMGKKTVEIYVLN